MSSKTLAYWRTKGSPALVPVAVVAEPEPEPESTHLSVLTVECGPLRVHGLGVSGVAELLRRLR